MKTDKQPPQSDRIREDSHFTKLCREGKRLRREAVEADTRLIKFARDVRTRKVAANRANVESARGNMVSTWLTVGAHIRKCKKCIQPPVQG